MASCGVLPGGQSHTALLGSCTYKCEPSTTDVQPISSVCSCTAMKAFTVSDI